MNEASGETVTAQETIPPFEICLESSELAVRKALSDVLHKLIPLDLASEEVSTIEIVLAEVLNNIVEHAYPTDAPGCMIEIRCAHRDGGLDLQVVDSGQQLPDGKLPPGSLASLDVDLEDLPEGGFGWFMIQHLSKTVHYRRQNGKNFLDLRLAVGACN